MKYNELNSHAQHISTTSLFILYRNATNIIYTYRYNTYKY